MWGLGCLIWETYNGTLNTSSQLKVTGQVNSLLFYFTLGRVRIFTNFY